MIVLFTWNAALTYAVAFLVGGLVVILLSDSAAKSEHRPSEFEEAGEVGNRSIWTMRWVDMPLSRVRLIYRIGGALSLCAGVIALVLGTVAK